MTITATEIFAVSSTLLAFVGGPFYLVDILRGKTKPERATWFVWSVQGLIAFGSQALLGAHWSLLFVGMNAFGNLTVFLLSLKYGVGGWKPIDIVSLMIAGIGLGVSLLTKSPLIALIAVIIADFAGTVPTFYKVYRLPKTETTVTWLAFATASVLAVFSVGSWQWSLIAYPLYLALDNYAIVMFQLLGRARSPKKTLRGRSRAQRSKRSYQFLPARR